jgi:hypothetical protein
MEDTRPPEAGSDLLTPRQQSYQGITNNMKYAIQHNTVSNIWRILQKNCGERAQYVPMYNIYIDPYDVGKKMKDPIDNSFPTEQAARDVIAKLVENAKKANEIADAWETAEKIEVN